MAVGGGQTSAGVIVHSVVTEGGAAAAVGKKWQMPAAADLTCLLHTPHQSILFN
jgi:hypothetical protein